VVNWTPTAADLGKYTVLVKVADSGNGVATNVLHDQQTLTLNVRTSNQAPAWVSAGDQTIPEGQTLTARVQAVDPDSDQVTYSASNLPVGAKLDPITGIANAWDPNADDAVFGIAADGGGGCYIGGLFSSVCGQAHSGVAHILAGNSANGWDPEPDAGVRALAVDSAAIYVGGDFAFIGGLSRSGLAAITTNSPTPTPKRAAVAHAATGKSRKRA
jgi:hypothetical protein